MKMFGFNETVFAYYIYFILIAIVHIALAIGVYKDGIFLRSKKFDTFLVPPAIWSAAVLIGGIIPVIGYWLIHHSSIRSARPPWLTETQKKENTAEQDAAANP